METGAKRRQYFTLMGDPPMPDGRGWRNGTRPALSVATLATARPEVSRLA